MAKRCSETGCRRARYQDHAVCITHRLDTLKAAARVIVDAGTCPQCGTGLVYNNALAGWWQCGAYAAESHRQPQYRGLPSCSFQTFTA